MNCDERRELLLLRALGALEPEEEAALQRQLDQECPPVAQVQAEVDATLAQLAVALPPAEVRPAAKAAFMARLAAAPAARRAVPPALPQPLEPMDSSQPAGPGLAPPPRASLPAPRTWPAAMAAAGAAALLAIGLTWWPAHRQERLARERAEHAEQRLAQAELDLRQAKQAAELRADQLQQQLASAQGDLRSSQEATVRTTAAFEQQLAKAEAGLREMRAAVDAKVAGLTRQLAEVDTLLATARTEIARRDAEVDALTAQSKQFAEWATGAKAQLVALQDERAALARKLDQAEGTLAALRSPKLKLVDLASGGPQPRASGRLLWDQQRDTWHLVATNLAPAPAGRTYELWFITAGQAKIAAGTFAVDAGGSGELTVAVPPGIGPLALAAVTDEPAGGVAAPTGSIQLVGKL